MKNKTCSNKKCKNLTKPISEFHKDKNNKDGLYCYCKECVKDYNLKNKEKIKDRMKEYYSENKEEFKIYNKKYYEENKEKTKTRNKKYRDNNREVLNKKASHREKILRKTDINFRIKGILRSRIREALKRNTKSDTTKKLLGCSVESLKQHLESQFTDEMNWDNYGKWHVDHIKPCASFDMSKPSQQRECFNYTNLQPLWALDNLKKGSKFRGNNKKGEKNVRR